MTFINELIPLWYLYHYTLKSKPLLFCKKINDPNHCCSFQAVKLYRATLNSDLKSASVLLRLTQRHLGWVWLITDSLRTSLRPNNCFMKRPIEHQYVLFTFRHTAGQPWGRGAAAEWAECAVMSKAVMWCMLMLAAAERSQCAAKDTCWADKRPQWRRRPGSRAVTLAQCSAPSFCFTAFMSADTARLFLLILTTLRLWLTASPSPRHINTQLFTSSTLNPVRFKRLLPTFRCQTGSTAVIHVLPLLYQNSI